MFFFNPGSGKNLVGREDEIKFITEQCCLGQNVVLSAPRRFGKTTLMQDILSKLRERNFFTAYIDIFPVTSINHLSAEISESVLKNVELDQEFIAMKNQPEQLRKHPKFRHVAESFEFLLRFNEKNPANYPLLSDCLDFAEQFSIRYKKRMVFVFDEFGDLLKFEDGKLLRLIKSKIQKHINTSYIFTGSYDAVLKSLFEGAKAPLVRSARKLSLQEIDQNTLANHFRAYFSFHQVVCPDEYIQKVLEFTGGHPYYSELAMQTVAFHYMVYNKIPAFEELPDKLIHAEKDYLEKTWEDIATSRQNIKTVLAVTKGGGGVYSSLRNSNVNIYRSLKTLLGDGTLLVNPDKTYRMSDPLLNYWIQKKVHKVDVMVVENEN
jgi:hypothetical protein